MLVYQRVGIGVGIEVYCFPKKVYEGMVANALLSVVSILADMLLCIDNNRNE